MASTPDFVATGYESASGDKTLVIERTGDEQWTVTYPVTDSSAMPALYEQVVAGHLPGFEVPK